MKTECRMQNAECRKDFGSFFCILHSVFCILFFLSCARAPSVPTIEFWGLGREGEVVAQLVPQFTRETGIRVDVQQIPWSAAHEKLLTAHVGGSLPDCGQVGNTWIPELATIRAVAPLNARIGAAVPQSDYFPGIWQTNVVGGVLYGIPWYVDTRLLFYKTDLIPKPPRTWSEWVAEMERLKRTSTRPGFHPMLMPTTEWTIPVALASQRGAVMVDDKANARFDDPRFVEAFAFYLDLYRRGFAPAVSQSQIANLYQQFDDGEFAMFVSGPWDVGNLRERLPASRQSAWSTAPMPASDGAPYPGASISGGSSLVLFRKSKKHDASWKFIEFLSRPDIQARFYQLTADLPARRSAWRGLNDDKIAAFRTQLERTVALPALPEMENIVIVLSEHAQLAARSQHDAQRTAKMLDTKVDAMLEKRRWVLTRERHPERSEGSGGVSR